jgi:hypothetical protein
MYLWLFFGLDGPQVAAVLLGSPGLGIVIALIAGPPYFLRKIILKKNTGGSTLYKVIKIIFLSIYSYSIILLFLLTLFTETADYHKAIDPVDARYTAFATEHFLSAAIWYVLFISAMIALCVKGRDLPPLALSLCIVFVIIGMILNIVILAQYFDTENRCWRNGVDIQAYHHIMTVLFSAVMLIKIVRQENELAINRRFDNKYLNAINRIVGRHCFWWALVLLMPVFIVMTIILILFGQEKDSLLKVWTETTTWTFSQHVHPPYLGHNGHYLCTVAACGHQAVVRPLRLGMRRNRVIIVNRQLLVANAYEEMIHIYFPAFHKAIRKIYDTCGYPISKNITNKYISDIVYILMKPLEYFFVINLYLFVKNPEDLINKQYRLDTVYQKL